jgi:hypothetical protein
MNAKSHSNPGEGYSLAIRVYIIATLLLSLIALAFFAFGFTARHSEILRWVFFEPSAPGRDITYPVRFKEWRHLGAMVYSGGPGTADPWFIYCPFGFFVVVFFMSIPSYPAEFLGAFVAIFVLAGSYCLWRQIRSNRLAVRALVTALLTSYPFLFLFERGNTEGIVLIPLVAGVYCFIKKNYLAAALLFSLAACIKPLPALMFLLFLPKRRYREFFICVVLTTAVSLVSLNIIGPTFAIALRETIVSFGSMNELAIMRYNAGVIGADHSLFALIKVCLRLLSGWPAPEKMTGILHTAYPYYQFLSLLILGFSLFRVRQMPILNQILALSVLMVLIPPMNFDYTLISIYLPWSMLLFALVKPGVHFDARIAALIMVLCAIIFTSQYYLVVGRWTDLGGQVKTVALLGLLFISWTYQLSTEAFENSQARTEQTLRT